MKLDVRGKELRLKQGLTFLNNQEGEQILEHPHESGLARYRSTD